MSLTRYVRPGDALDAADLVTDFTDLQTLANDVQAEQVKDWSMVGPALGAGWKSAQISEPAVPATWITPAGAAQSLHSSLFTTYAGEPVVIMAGCQVQFTAGAGELILSIRVDGVSQYKLAWYGGKAPLVFGSPVNFYASLPLIIEGKVGSPPATTDIALWSELDSVGGATVNWRVNYVQIEVLGVYR